jgi:hypothetical protein
MDLEIEEQAKAIAAELGHVESSTSQASTPRQSNPENREGDALGSRVSRFKIARSQLEYGVYNCRQDYRWFRNTKGIDLFL